MGKLKGGNIVFASTFTKNNASPIDDRTIVAFIQDLTDFNVWKQGANNDETRYEGMIVYVDKAPSDTQYTYGMSLDPNSQDYKDWYASLPDEGCLYYLKDFDNRNLITGWQKMGNSSVTIRTW